MCPAVPLVNMEGGGSSIPGIDEFIYLPGFSISRRSSAAGSDAMFPVSGFDPEFLGGAENVIFDAPLPESSSAQTLAQRTEPSPLHSSSKSFPLSPIIPVGDQQSDLRLLIVEDDDYVRVVLSSMLETMGTVIQAPGSSESSSSADTTLSAGPTIYVHFVSTGEEGYQLLHRGGFDVCAASLPLLPSQTPAATCLGSHVTLCMLGIPTACSRRRPPTRN
jgi:CheY-like chemotaxis protein